MPKKVDLELFIPLPCGCPERSTLVGFFRKATEVPVSRFLTKSRFKVGLECPRKLTYLDDPSYGSTKKDNEFLEALAEGGFQVGELAKLYHPGGVEVVTLDKAKAVAETNALLKQENVIIFEAAIEHENLFMRADIIVKKGNRVDLIEVKAKSFDPEDPECFFTKTSLKKGPLKLSSEWEPYVMDVAFQAHLLAKAFPKFEINSFLMLADKTASASVDGLNQNFLIETYAKGRAGVRVKAGISEKDIGSPVLCKINVDQAVAVAQEQRLGSSSFAEHVEYLSKVCASIEIPPPQTSSGCKNCEFRGPFAEKSKSGFDECWMQERNLSQEAIRNPFVFDVWNFKKSQKLLNEGAIFLTDIEEDDISPTENKKNLGLSPSERQWLQVKKEKEKDRKPFIDLEGLRSEMAKWKFPLHFIDFETSMVAIPFNKGRHPYEQIAFQFSHHTINEKKEIVHANQFLNRERGKFPNFDFVRELKKALDNDSGTIFRYATHENTVLCQIREQLISSREEIKDRDELLKFIESITTATKSSGGEWIGPRSMVDLCDLVKRYFYHPLTMGSNSIKQVLPAILNESKELQAKYSKPIYGTKEMPSKNFSKRAWVEIDKLGSVKDPYKQLPPIYSDAEQEAMDALFRGSEIANGGAAMTAYARMQFSEMTAAEADRVSKAMLQYCELDTLAMVMIFQYWNDELQNFYKKSA